MANDSSKRPPIRTHQPNPPDKPYSSVQRTATRAHGVVSIQDWKKRPSPKSPTWAAHIRPYKEDVRLLSMAQKQAALLRVILSDTIAEADLDAMIQTAVSMVP